MDSLSPPTSKPLFGTGLSTVHNGKQADPGLYDSVDSKTLVHDHEAQGQFDGTDDVLLQVIPKKSSDTI